MIDRSPIDGEDNVAGLCCHLEEQVRALHTRVCESLQRKYSSILRCDDHTAHLSNDVIVQFALVRPVFEHLEKVRSLIVCLTSTATVLFLSCLALKVQLYLKGSWICLAPHCEKLASEALRYGSHSCYTANTPYLPLLRSSHQMAPSV